MIGRVILAALLAGVAAGFIMGVIQHFKLTPLILEAEVFETAGGAGHSHETGPAIAGADEPEEWNPEGGWERTFYTTAASMLAGAGFAAVLVGIALLSGIPLTARNGLLWGLAGFISVNLAPAMGLSPELPGMPAGDLLARQIWWIGTIVATGIGIYLFAIRRQPWAIAVGIALIIAPHLIGAPQPPTHESGVPAGLAAQFAANSLAAAAAFWCVIGVFSGLALDRTAKGVWAT
ncbi:MAG: CbtA family protein [Rhizobiales bacterium]|nr:CbtA family protein [Hyphomicrobiales bacterium]